VHGEKNLGKKSLDNIEFNQRIIIYPMNL